MIHVLVNKKTLEGLVLAGAFDSIDKNRAKLFDAVEAAIDFSHKVQNSKLLSQNSLFGDSEEVQISEPVLPEVKPWSELEILARERSNWILCNRSSAPKI